MDEHKKIDETVFDYPKLTREQEEYEKEQLITLLDNRDTKASSNRKLMTSFLATRLW